jgi:hypothetical protein
MERGHKIVLRYRMFSWLSYHCRYRNQSVPWRLILRLVIHNNPIIIPAITITSITALQLYHLCNPVEYTEGNTLNIIDRKLNKLVWTGTAKGFIFHLILGITYILLCTSW